MNSRGWVKNQKKKPTYPGSTWAPDWRYVTSAERADTVNRQSAAFSSSGSAACGPRARMQGPSNP